MRQAAIGIVTLALCAATGAVTQGPGETVYGGARLDAGRLDQVRPF